MRHHWSSAQQDWEVYFDDPADPAIEAYGFSAEAAEWLADPVRRVGTLASVGTVSASVFNRLCAYARQGRVQLVCRADAPSVTGRRPAPPRPPGHSHMVLLGPDWTDHSWMESRRPPAWLGSVALPVPSASAPEVDPPVASPDWTAFHAISPDVGASLEALAGAVLGGIHPDPPVILLRPSWGVALDPLLLRLGDQRALPEPIGAPGDALRLQRNYYGVETFLLRPGILLRTDMHETLQVGEESLDEWLRRELEEGTRGQRPRLSHPEDDESP